MDVDTALGGGGEKKREKERKKGAVLSTVESARGRPSSAPTSDFCSQLNGRRKQGRAGEEERRKRQQRECDRAVMEGWGGGDEGGAV